MPDHKPMLQECKKNEVVPLCPPTKRRVEIQDRRKCGKPMQFVQINHHVLNNQSLEKNIMGIREYFELDGNKTPNTGRRAAQGDTVRCCCAGQKPQTHNLAPTGKQKRSRPRGSPQKASRENEVKSK